MVDPSMGAEQPQESEPVQANDVVLSGLVVTAPDLRYTPAGTAIAQWELEHHSQVTDLPPLQGVALRIQLIAAGALAQECQLLHIGDRIKVRGRLNQKRHQRSEETRWGKLELVVRQIKLEQAVERTLPADKENGTET
uniref:Putative Single-strand binding protein/Primosomal replication protein n=1 Tax=Magnetococcus massalia (strain MO-1) TaxID=451514 RepID=A0A1S7LDL3_MAGMO|nr:putative Single-strand binding protein/Primosomal replication protein [Candidatus Magnetococcus massalia]